MTASSARATVKAPITAQADPRSRLRVGDPLQEALGLLLLAALVPAQDIWAVQALLLGLVLYLPGRLLLRALRVPREAIRRFPLYIPSASLVVLLVASLAANLLAPLVGVDDPLRTGPLLVTLELVCGALLLAALKSPAWQRLVPSNDRMAVLDLWPLLLPLGAAAGAALMNNGHGALVAAVVLGMGLVALSAGIVLGERLGAVQLALLLYGVALAALWSFSLRSPFVYGFDIATEFQVVTGTINDGEWATRHPDDAYGAMLSLTTLPALLHEVTGLSVLVLLKAVYPALFALVPVGVYLIAQRYLAARWAFFAAAFVLAQSYFVQQLPGIARQEIALLLYAALVACVLERTTRRRWLPLIALFSAAVVVTHYSSAYLALGVFGLAAVVQLVVSFLRPLDRVSVPALTAFAALALSAFVWYVPVTDSADNVGRFTDRLEREGLDLLPSAKAGGSIVESYLVGNLGTERVTPQEYARLVQDQYAEARPYVEPLEIASEDRFELEAAGGDERAEKPQIVSSAADGLRLVSNQLVNLLAVAASLVLLLGRTTSGPLRLLAALAVATLAVIAVMRVSGTASVSYNQERAFVQTFIVLAICCAWLPHAITSRRPQRTSIVAAIATLVVAGVYIGGTGLQTYVLGGSPAVNLASSGEDFERFYVTEPELAAGRWLDGAARGPEPVYADRYGQLRVLASGGDSDGLLLDITPRTLHRNAWIYGSRTNVNQVRVRGQHDRSLAVYRWPRLIGEHWGKVYTNGSSNIYYR